MSTKFSSVTSAADGCGKPSSVRLMDSSHSSNMERKESLMYSNRSSVISRGGCIAAMALAVAAVAGLAGTASANMIQNGDFSANGASFLVWPGYSGESGTYNGNPYTNPAAPTDWTVFTVGNGTWEPGVNGTSGTAPNAAYGAPFTPTTLNLPDNSYYGIMQFTGDYLSQTVATTAGESYTLSYLAAGRNIDSTGLDVLNVVLTDAINSNTITTQVPGISQAQFNPFTLTFTATSASTNVEFLNNSTNSNNTVEIANVAMAPVPEPATLGVFAIGGLGLLLLKRRKAV
ncbi:MAG: PEP-CTERM sorting domain-containing protein [Planctomycetia bacterium]|nr:PEP-CTERM sorting domain-containing protein [Planctomycetia bacterium]